MGIAGRIVVAPDGATGEAGTALPRGSLAARPAPFPTGGTLSDTPVVAVMDYAIGRPFSRARGLMYLTHPNRVECAAMVRRNEGTQVARRGRDSPQA